MKMKMKMEMEVEMMSVEVEMEGTGTGTGTGKILCCYTFKTGAVGGRRQRPLFDRFIPIRVTTTTATKLGQPQE